MTTTAAYGTWPSPLSIDDALSAGVGLRTMIGDGDDVYWLETLPEEDGRTTLVRHRRGTTTEVTPTPINVRSRVMEYGGGGYDVRDGWAVYCNDADGALHVLSPDHQRRPITPEASQFRFGGVRIHPKLGLVTAVRENHAGDGEAITEVVALRVDSDNADGGTVLASGADFYANVEVSGAGRIIWVEWDHPQMPWDVTRVRLGQLTNAPNGTPGVRPIGVSAMAASQLNVGFVSDTQADTQDDTKALVMVDDGHWRPHLWDGVGKPSLIAASGEHDHVPPMWILDNQQWALFGSDLVVAPFVDGRRQLVRLSLADNQAQAVNLGEPVAGIDSLTSAAGRVWLIAQPDDRPAEVVAVDPKTGRRQVVRSASGEVPASDNVSVPESIWVTTPRGLVQAWFYRPRLAGFAAPAGELPPLIVRSHGGPTSLASASYYETIQFWTTRGIAVVDVNYSGSTGFGRDYRERLRGEWGLADVDDCVAVVRHLGEAGLVDPSRVAITGGSAGGYTTLQALVSSDVFSAGISRYGIGDLEVLATDTHKFEARYLDSLIGPYPQDRQTYLDRSPIHHVDQLSTPMLILQGLDDKVVSPNQAHDMADAVRAKSLPVALVLFEGEGHGFRTMASRRRALESELSFLAQIFGFTPADDIATLPIENL